MQAAMVITVDTAELRGNSSPEQLSPNQLKLQQRLAGWAPKSPTELSFADKLEGASRRRHSLVEERTSKLQESNTRASIVAEQQRAKFADAISGKAAHVAAKEASADQKRKAFVSAKEEAAATHFEHAKTVALQQKALKKQKVEQAIDLTESRSNEAGARRAKLLAESQIKNGAVVAKAHQLADQKRAAVIALRIKNEDKLAAAEARRMDIQDDMIAKLAESEEKARQVRRNKGSTTPRTDDDAEKKIIAEPVAFDIEFDRQPPSPNKTPVQLRLEASAGNALNFNDEKAEGATRRRLSLAEGKVESLVKTNANKKDVAAKHSDAAKAKLEEAKQAAAAKITAAEDRRAALLSSVTEKAGGHVKAALENASNQKTGQQQELVEKKRRLSKELLEHDTRRAAALKAKAAPLSPKRTPTKQQYMATAEC